jgi:hypothetical protein
MSSKAYQQIIDRGAQIMARILKHTSNVTTVHALAEPGPLAADLFIKVAECAAQHPDQDIIIYVQRVNTTVINEALKKKG